MTLGRQLSTAIEQHVRQVLNAHKAGVPIPEPIDFFTDNFGELLDKLIVIHIRVWNLEDWMGCSHGDDERLADLKKKMDVLWKRKRPAIVAAINRMIDDSLIHGRSLVEDSLKIYKGFEGEKCPACGSASVGGVCQNYGCEGKFKTS